MYKSTHKPDTAEILQDGIGRLTNDSSVKALYTQDVQTCVVFIICSEGKLSLMHLTRIIDEKSIKTELDWHKKISHITVVYKSSEYPDGIELADSFERYKRFFDESKIKLKFDTCDSGFVTVNLLGKYQAKIRPQNLIEFPDRDLRYDIIVINSFFAYPGEKLIADFQFDGRDYQRQLPKILKTKEEIYKNELNFWPIYIKDCRKHLQKMTEINKKLSSRSSTSVNAGLFFRNSSVSVTKTALPEFPLLSFGISGIDFGSHLPEFEHFIKASQGAIVRLDQSKATIPGLCTDGTSACLTFIIINENLSRMTLIHSALNFAENAIIKECEWVGSSTNECTLLIIRGFEYKNPDFVKKSELETKTLPKLSRAIENSKVSITLDDETYRCYPGSVAIDSKGKIRTFAPQFHGFIRLGQACPDIEYRDSINMLNAIGLALKDQYHPLDLQFDGEKWTDLPLYNEYARSLATNTDRKFIGADIKHHLSLYDSLQKFLNFFKIKVDNAIYRLPGFLSLAAATIKHVREYPKHETFLQSLIKGEFPKALRQACAVNSLILVKLLFNFFDTTFSAKEIIAFINDQPSSGETALHRAAKAATKDDKYDLLNYLLEKDADPDVKNKSGKTYLDILEESPKKSPSKLSL